MSQAAGPSQSAQAYLKQAFFTGLAITIPAIVTLLVLVFAFDFVSGLLKPLTDVAQQALGLGRDLPTTVVQVLAGVLLGVVIMLVGLTAESRYGGGGLARRVEDLLTSIPGIGSVYQSINEISELLLESDTESFKEVKLIEYPDDGSYTLGFLTADTPEAVRQATGHGEMVTLFMPMAPNPVMGGFVVHVSADRVHDVDMTVEEGIQSIVSSGVAVEDPDEGQEVEPLSNAGETAGGELI
jgi:uncharacterized membrane protein